MSTKHYGTGKVTGTTVAALFNLEEAITLMNNHPQVVHVKIAPGTQVHDMISHVVERHPGITHTKAARLLMKAGYLAFKRSIEQEQEGL